MKKVIYDTDFGNDADDAIGLALLHRLTDLGEAEIVAMASCISNLRAPGAMDAVNVWYGRGNFEVGRFRGLVNGEPLFPTGPGTVLPSYADEIYHQFRTKGVYPRFMTDDYAPDAVRVYRRALRDAVDGSLTIVTVGMLTNLSDLLDSVADDIDPRTGAALIAAKVESVHIMGGHSTNGATEFNLTNAPAHTFNVGTNLPVPIYWHRTDVGNDVRTGRWTSTNHERHILRFALERYSDVTAQGGGGRPSWDPMAVLEAVRGAAAGFAYTAGNMVINNSNGANTWTAGSSPRNHFVVAKTLAASSFVTTIDNLIWTAEATPPDRRRVYINNVATDEEREAHDWTTWAAGEVTLGPLSKEDLPGESFYYRVSRPDLEASSWFGPVTLADPVSDLIAPLFVSASIPSEGTSISIVFNEAVQIGTGESAGFALVTDPSGPVTASYASGSGSSTLVYTLSRTVTQGEIVTVAYTQPGNGIEDLAGNDLASFTAQEATNSSTVQPPVDPGVVSFIGPAINSFAGQVGISLAPMTVAPRFTDSADEVLTFSALGAWPDGVTVTSLGVIQGMPTLAGPYVGLAVRATNESLATADSNLFDVTVAAGEPPPPDGIIGLLQVWTGTAWFPINP